METQRKTVWCCKDTTQWKIFIVLSILLILFKIAGFCSSQWFYQGEKNKQWKGGMFSVYDSGGLIETSSYYKLAEFYCTETETFSFAGVSPNITYYEATSLCTTFSNLSGGIPALLAFSIISIAFGTTLTVLLIFCSNKEKGIVCYIILSVFQLICEFVCLVALGASSQFTLAGDCIYLSMNGNSVNQVKTCADIGCVWTFFTSLAILVFDFFVILLTCTYRNCSKIVESQENHPDNDNQIRVERAELAKNNAVESKEAENVD